MMDLDVLITGGVGVVTTFISGFTSYLFTRRKYDAEVDTDRIENLQKSLDFYEHNQELNTKILEGLQKDNIELRAKNKELKEKIDKYEYTIKRLTDRISKLEDILNTDGNSIKEDSKKR